MGYGTPRIKCRKSQNPGRTGHFHAIFGKGTERAVPFDRKMKCSIQAVPFDSLRFPSFVQSAPVALTAACSELVFECTVPVSRNWRKTTPPGCGGFFMVMRWVLSVVIDILLAVVKTENHPPVGAYGNRPKAFHLTFERMQPQRRLVQVGNDSGGVKSRQDIPQRLGMFRINPPWVVLFKMALQSPVADAPYRPAPQPDTWRMSRAILAACPDHILASLAVYCWMSRVSGCGFYFSNSSVNWAAGRGTFWICCRP